MTEQKMKRVMFLNGPLAGEDQEVPYGRTYIHDESGVTYAHTGYIVDDDEGQPHQIYVMFETLYLIKLADIPSIAAKHGLTVRLDEDIAQENTQTFTDAIGDDV